MKEKEIPLYAFLAIFLTLGVFIIKTETDKVALRRETTQAAAAAQALTASYQRMTTSVNETTALTMATNARSQDLSTVRGTLAIVYNDQRMEPNEGSSQEAYLITNAGRATKIENISRVPLPDAVNGISLELTGKLRTARGKQILTTNFNAADVRTLRPKRLAPPAFREKSRSATCDGNFCALVILVDKTNGAMTLPLPSDIHDYLFTNPGRVKAAFSEQSYGAMQYGGTVTEWIPVSGEVNIWSAPAAVAQYIATNGINISAYDQVLFLVNGGEETNGGLASIGPATFDVNGVSYTTRVARVGFSSYANRENLLMANGNLSYFDHVVIHETGHNLGALHDNFLNCKSGPVSLPSECIAVEYGNNFSTMGGGAFSGHFSFQNKMRLGWVGAGSVTRTISGSAQLMPIENAGATFLAADQGLNGTPEYAFERRMATGIDTPSLFPNVNFSGALTYRQVPGYSWSWITSDPTTWNLLLTDTSPATSSSAWPNALYDAVLKLPQRFADTARGFGFRQMAGGGNNVPEIYTLPPAGQTCAMSPIKVFESPIASDMFPGQVNRQKWPIASATGSGATPNIHADVADVSGQALLYKDLVIFNDDTVNCAAGTYTFKMKFAGAELPLLSDTTASYESWTGPNYQTLFAFLPTYGLTYGPQTVTIEITKQNDGTVFTKNLNFNLVP